MKLFDCTLRDGANVVGNGFGEALTRSMIGGLLSCGICEIELGNAKGLGAYEKQGAKAPLTDEEYGRVAQEYAGQGHLGMFLQAQLADEKSAAQAASWGLDFLRVGAAAGNGRDALAAVKIVKEAKLRCRYSQMKAYICTPKELAKEAEMLEAAGVDAVTIMDSAGTMFPEETKRYVDALKSRVSIPVGFHGHSNLGLSQANALAAAEAGADEIDCGLLGMARSAGNCATELAAATFYRENLLEGVDLFGLLEYLNRELIPEMQKYGYRAAVSPDDLMLGLSGCHSAFLEMFRKTAQEEQVSLYRLMLEVSQIEKNRPGEELLRQTAAKIKKGA